MRRYRQPVKNWYAHALASTLIAVGLPLIGIWLIPTPDELGSTWVWIAFFTLVCAAALAALRWFRVSVPEPTPPKWIGWLDDK